LAGLVLAAGAGSRMGTPKALLRDEKGLAWAVRAVRALRAGGCGDVHVVVGALGDEVAAELESEDVRVVEASHWAEGMGASLRAGLAALADTDANPTAVLVAVVDMPGLDAAVVRRMARYAVPDALARATYHGIPGHPVVLGCEHLDEVARHAHGDVGARDFLRDHPPSLVECSDLSDGTDVDEPGQLPPGHHLG
jgi:CTP:molybdopterin cytidylyltransferase MocA